MRPPVGRPPADSETDAAGSERLRASLSAEALRANYAAIHAQVPDQSILPMIKANAYGHDAAWAARTLARSPGLYALGVATLEEGRVVREALRGTRPKGVSAARARTGSATRSPAARLRGTQVKVMVFSGVSPWTRARGEYCRQFGLTPVLASDEDWREFHRQKWHREIAYELEFNTGMNRLGISLGQAEAIVRTLRDEPGEAQPEGIFSHLAMGEDPRAALSLQQRERFAALRRQMAPAFPAAFFHLGNSAAIWNAKSWGLDGLTDVVRPGLALYGVPPWNGAPARGIVPVMTLEAPVMLTRRLMPGESMGYGAMYRVPTRGATRGAAAVPMHTAILAAGYADGILRAMGGDTDGPGGHLWLGGRAERFLGRVSMDLCGVSCLPAARAGDRAEILGPRVDIWAQATIAGTIPYELLTSVSSRVQRIYG